MERLRDKAGMAKVFRENFEAGAYAYLRLALYSEFLVCETTREKDAEWVRLVSAAICQMEIKDWAQLRRTIRQFGQYESE